VLVLKRKVHDDLLDLVVLVEHLPRLSQLDAVVQLQQFFLSGVLQVLGFHGFEGVALVQVVATLRPADELTEDQELDVLHHGQRASEVAH